MSCVELIPAKRQGVQGSRNEQKLKSNFELHGFKCMLVIFNLTCIKRFCTFSILFSVKSVGSFLNV